jgi:hypothetical protein
VAEGGATGSTSLDVKQRAVTIGEVIPIVFCRRVGSNGGVLVAPGATEARFSNDTSNTLTASYQLVVGEGQMDPLLVKDVFQRACRIGTWAQSYNQRAGTWTPGNFVTAKGGFAPPECPYYCGTSGNYEGVTTLSFTNTYPNGETRWDRQIFAFVRGGIHVPRLMDGITGPSNNFADLVRILLQRSSRVTASKIDTASLVAAANFTHNTGLWFNGVVDQSTNLEEWLAATAPEFLLRVVDKAGAKGLKPLVPVTAGNVINTAPITPVATFTEDHIAMDKFSISYIGAAERAPICATTLWRQQPDDDLGIIRSSQSRYEGEAVDGPFLQYDLSDFCGTENHAVKIGAFRIARRRYVSHTLQLALRPAAAAAAAGLGMGDVVRVHLRRETSLGVAGVHDYLYEINQIGRSISGLLTLDLVHFPVDENGASLIALAVAGATGSGYVLPTGKSGVSCDTNSSTSTTEIPSSGGNLDNLPSPDDTGDDNEQPDNEPSPKPVIIEKGEGNTGDDPQVGDTIAAPIFCSGASVTWYRKDPSVPGGRTMVQAPSSGLPYVMQINDKDLSVYAEVLCPDATSPITTGELGPVKAASISQLLGYGVYNVTCTITTTYSSRTNCFNGGVDAGSPPNVVDGGVSTGSFVVGKPSAVWGMKVVSVYPTSVAITICGASNSAANFVTGVEVYTIDVENGPWVLRGGFDLPRPGTYTSTSYAQKITTRIDMGSITKR